MSGSGIDTQAVLRRYQDVVWRETTSRDILVVKLDSDRAYFRITGIAAEFWLLLDGRKSVGTCAKRLVARHRPPMGRFRKDLQSLLIMLSKHGLVERTGR